MAVGVRGDDADALADLGFGQSEAATAADDATVSLPSVADGAEAIGVSQIVGGGEDLALFDEA